MSGAPSGSAPSGGAPSVRPRSIRVRLAAWYAGSFVAALLAGAFALRAVLRDAIRDDFARGLADTAALVQGFYRVEVREYRAPEPTVRHLAGELLLGDRAVAFVRPDGSTLALARPSPALVALPPEHRQVHEAPLHAGAPGWRIRVVASREPLDHALERMDLALAVSAPIALALAWGFGFWLTGRTLRPLRAMTEATDRVAGPPGAPVAAAPLGRLPIGDPRDEVGQLGTRVNALLERLDGALAQQRRFLGDAAHELRTPIARMRSRAELALLAPAGTAPVPNGDADDARAALADVAGDLARTSALVDALLRLARADAAVPQAALADGWLDDVVADAAAAFHGAARQAGVALDLGGLEETPARIDAGLVHHLVGVLVDNAIRYTPSGGRVAVRVAPDADGGALLEVADDGIGIAPAERAHVWERFWRGAEARRRAPDGSGLGLPIARWVAEQHGATLALLPNAPRGTVARVTFPAARPSGPAR